MTSSFHQLNEGPLSPSELLVLKGERFGDDASSSALASPLTHSILSTGLSVESILAVAFLANEQVGGIQLGLFITRRYEMTPATAGLLAQQDTEPVYQLLDDCRATRPQVWESLVNGISAGLKRRDMSV